MASDRHRQALMSAALLVLLAAGIWEMSRHSSSGLSVAPHASADAPSAAGTPDVRRLAALIPAETAGCLTMHYEGDRSAGVRRLRMQTVRAPVTDDAIDLLIRYSLQVRRVCAATNRIIWSLCNRRRLLHNSLLSATGEMPFTPQPQSRPESAGLKPFGDDPSLSPAGLLP